MTAPTLTDELADALEELQFCIDHPNADIRRKGLASRTARFVLRKYHAAKAEDTPS